MIIDELRKEINACRRSADKKWLVPSLQFAVSEIEKIGKAARNGPTTDDEAITALKKIVTNIRGTTDLSSDPVFIMQSMIEMEVLSALLPKMIAEGEMRALCNYYRLNVPPAESNKGALMKAARARWGATVDMKRLGELWDINT